ncbi:MAG: hypothetical protein AB7F98_14915 [Novosphingobium sp.]
MIPIVLQLAGSLFAILSLSLLAWKLGLGGDVRLRDPEQARMLANQAIWGFDAVEVALDRAGIGALLRNGEGQVMLLRRHGVHFVARLLDGHEGARLDRNFLTLVTEKGAAGTFTLDLGQQAQNWASSLRRLGGSA